jgi:hypothetical protein
MRYDQPKLRLPAATFEAPGMIKLVLWLSNAKHKTFLDELMKKSLLRLAVVEVIKPIPGIAMFTFHIWFPCIYT